MARQGAISLEPSAVDLNVGQSAVSPSAQALADVQLGCFIGRNSKHPQDSPGVGWCWQSAEMGWLLFGSSNLSMSVCFGHSEVTAYTCTGELWRVWHCELLEGGL